MRKSILVALSLVPSLALASGYSLPNTKARDLGLAASAVAAQNDSGAAFALPAALSRLDGWAASAAGGGVTIFTDWSDPTGTAADTEIDRGLTAIGNVSIAYGGKVPFLGADRGWGVGLSFQPFGGTIVSWPDDWAGRYRIVEVDRRSYSGTLTAGVEVLPRVRLGGGLVYYYTTQELSQKAWMAPFAANPLDPTTWNPALPDATGKLDGNGGALSWDISAEYQPLPDLPLTFAIDYKHQAVQDLDGDVKWQGLTPVAQALAASAAPIFADQGVTESLTIPNTLNVGAAYRVTKPLLVTLTYTFDRWSEYERDLFVGDNGATIALERDYGDGHTIRGGVEYDVSSAFQVRAGVQRDISGVKDRLYSPTLPDSSSWAGTLGATIKFARGLSIDAAAFYAIFDEVNVPSSSAGLEPPQSATQASITPTGTFRGNYDTNALVWNVSLNWRPGMTR